MLIKKKSGELLIEKIYRKAETAIRFGAEMPALTLVFDDNSCLVLYVEKAGDYLILKSYDTEHRIHKPLFVMGEFKTGNMEH